MHPDSRDIVSVQDQINSALEGICIPGTQVVALYPNADPGSEEFIKALSQYAKEGKLKLYRHIPREEFLSLMKTVDVMVGNSSSGIIEAGVFGTPVLNIGNRQANRDHGTNVFHVPYNKKLIHQELLNVYQKVVSIRKESSSTHPYGTGNSADIVIQKLLSIKDKSRIIQKQITY